MLLGDAASPRRSSEEARLPCLMERWLVRSYEMWWAPMVARLATRLARDTLRFFCGTDDYSKVAQLTMTASVEVNSAASSATSCPEPLSRAG
jgi:hypothetical protein